MLKLNKLLWIKDELRRVVSAEDIIASAFEGCPELQEFTFSKENEYDDNNYSDSVRLSYVNGYAVDWDSEYEEGDNDDENKLPKLDKRVVGQLSDVVHEIANDYDYGEITVVRENYLSGRKRTREDKNRQKYLASYFSGKVLPDSFFVKTNNEMLSLYYALDHGRFSTEAEFKILAQEGRMYAALRYAQEIVKGPLSEQIENFFLLNDSAEGEDHKHLQEYISWKNSLPIVELT